MKIRSFWPKLTVKVLIVCLEKRVLNSDHFCHEPKVPLRSWDRKELSETQNHCQMQLENGDPQPRTRDHTTRGDAPSLLHRGGHQAQPRAMDTL